MKDILDKVLATFKNYYVTLLLLAFATIEMMRNIYMSNHNIEVHQSSVKIILTLIFGAILAIGIKHIRMRLNNKQFDMLYLLIPILMLFVYFGVLRDLNSDISILEYFVLCFVSSISLFVIPFIGAKGDSDYYTYEALISLLITMITFQLLIMGIFLTLASVSLLFEFTVKDYLYMEITIFLMGFIMPTLFLTIIPNMDLKKKPYSKVINFMIMYIIFPILTVYTTVLYAYFIKILIALKWPSNVLGNLIIYYSLFSVAVLYFTNKMDNNKWSSWFVKIYPFSLIIPMLMMLATFSIRIREYGFTEVRYYALMIFTFVMMSIFIIKKTNKVKYIPLVLGALLLISVFGSLSAMNVSRWSQEKRLEKILIENNILVNNEIVKQPNLDKSSQYEIMDILIYLEENHKLDDIDYLPDGFAFNNMEKVFGFPPSYRW
jgi:hypothetical protein